MQRYYSPLGFWVLRFATVKSESGGTKKVQVCNKVKVDRISSSWDY